MKNLVCWVFVENGLDLLKLFESGIQLVKALFLFMLVVRGSG